MLDGQKGDPVFERNEYHFTRRAQELLGAVFKSAWPVCAAIVFGDLLRLIDQADATLRQRASAKGTTNQPARRKGEGRC
jgi:hypothetical protein